MKRLSIIFPLAVLLCTPTRGEVVDSSSNGFSLQGTVRIAAESMQVYETLTGRVGKWWSSDHSFSKESANLSIDAGPGGCFCEKLPGGGVQHMEVIFADAGKTLIMKGGPGPLLAMGAIGALTVRLKVVDKATELSYGYSAVGYVSGGMQGMAPSVDLVLGEQFERLKRFIETGSPE